MKLAPVLRTILQTSVIDELPWTKN